MKNNETGGNMYRIIKKISGHKPDLLGKDNYFMSAVLVPLIQTSRGTEILFEVRSMDLGRQPGEICFPGGRVEEDEKKNPETAALRETREELGLQNQDLRILAPLDFLVTPMGPVLYPYVGEIMMPIELIAPNSKEVASIFTVPVSYLLSVSPQRSYTEVATRYGNNFPIHRVPEVYRGGWKKRWSFPTYAYEYDKYFIWGMTAVILHDFLEKIK